MQQRELPPLPAAGSSIDGGIYILFDPSLSSHYKVVIFSPSSAKRGTLTHLYDSETHTWKVGGKHKQSASTFCNGIYFNGSIYFVRLGYRFDPDGNLSKIPIPSRHYSLGMQNQNFSTELNGVLCFLSLYRRQRISCLLHVWEMKENGRGWSNLYETDLQQVLNVCGAKSYVIRSVGMIREEKEQDTMLILPFPRKKMVICRFYDKGIELQDHSSREFLEDKPGYLHDFFIQTLAPV